MSQPVQDAAALISAARERPRPVYLLIGEPFQTGSVARELIDVLVPPDRRSFNVETYDGRTAPIAPILDSLRMPGLFPGTKLVWMREPTLFLSGEKRSDVADKMLAAASEERHAEAAEKLLTLAALGGWTQSQFAAADFRTASESELNGLLGRSADGGERQALAAVHAYCRERNLTVAGYRDESGLLEEFLKSGMPPQTVLLFTAAEVDRRKRIVKAVGEAGAVLELTVERERTGALAAGSVDQIVRAITARAGKRIAPAAHRLILQRAGSDVAALTGEVEKLCLYAGERASIEEADVRAVVRDLGESWIFDFTKALSQRQAGEALKLLRGLFAQGEPPLRLLAVIARELRTMLLARDCLATFGDAWNARVQYNTFRDRLLPRLTEDQREALGNIHPYVLFLTLQSAGRASTARLQRGVLRLHDLDIRLKSSAADARVLMEAFVMELCAP